MALALATAPAAASAQRPTAPGERFPVELDRYLTAVLTRWRIPGLAVAVVRNDSVLVAGRYGVRELGKPDPVDEQVQGHGPWGTTFLNPGHDPATPGGACLPQARALGCQA